MTAVNKREDVAFVAIYADGQVHSFAIDRFTLRHGDHVARLVAVERQRQGRLDAGKIVDVRRLDRGK